MPSQPTLSFLDFDVVKIVLDRGDLDKNFVGGEFKVNIKYSCNINEANKNDFISSFVITINHSKFPMFNFQLEAAGKFLINGEPNQVIYQNFTEISAPSIVYPYIRAFVSNIFTQSGLRQLYIPSINFSNKRDALSGHGISQEIL